MTDTPPNPWLHRWSVLTVCAAVVTMGFGSVVTNFKAGMADRVWPTLPDALLRMTAEQRQNVPLVIEHSHRAAAWAAGGSVAVLAVLLWLFERRRSICWFGTAGLVGVSVQALLGGLRVTEDAHWGTEFKIFHGCFAPVVLSLLMIVAVATSRGWQVSTANSTRLRRGSWYVLAAVYAQIVLGVLLRHTYSPWAQRGHLLTAFLATAGVLWLVRMAWVDGDRALRIAAIALASALGLQLALGVEVWMAQLSHFAWPETLPMTPYRIAVRTAHVLGGSLLLSATVAVNVLTWRDTVSAARPALSGARLEEAA